MKKRKYLKGSFTVEVALLMPFLVVMILMLFYFTLYMYNRGVMQSAVCRGAKQLFYNIAGSNEEMETACTQVILADLEGNMVAVKDINLSVKVTATKVEIILDGLLNVPEVLMWEFMDLQELWKLRLEWSEPRLHAAEMIRSGQQLEGLVDAMQESD